MYQAFLVSAVRYHRETAWQHVEVGGEVTYVAASLYCVAAGGVRCLEVRNIANCSRSCRSSGTERYP